MEKKKVNGQDTFSTNEQLANKMYQPSDYQANDQLSQGLAETHEQVSDAYMEGTLEATIENVQGTGGNGSIPRDGYDDEK